jgi:hypothetical protein
VKSIVLPLSQRLDEAVQVKMVDRVERRQMEPESKFLFETLFLANLFQNLLTYSLHLYDNIWGGNSQGVVDVLFGKDEQMFLGRCSLDVSDDVVLLIFVVKVLLSIFDNTAKDAVFSINLIAKDPFS